MVRLLRRTAGAGLLCAVAVAASGCAAMGGGSPDPPALMSGGVDSMVRVARGDSAQLSPNIWIFVPAGYQLPATGDVTLTVHFHSEEWFSREVHTRRHAMHPLVTVGGLQGSNAYMNAFGPPGRFGVLLADVEDYFRRHGASSEVRVVVVDLSSCGPGYAAVREILKHKEYLERIRAVVLADSMYAGFAVSGGGADRAPRPEHVEPFIDFAQQCINGKKSFLTTYSQTTPAGFAGAADTAQFIVQRLQGELQPVKPGSCPAAKANLPYPLLFRFDRGGVHVWGYAGADEGASTAHARALGDFWRALDAGEDSR